MFKRFFFGILLMFPFLGFTYGQDPLWPCIQAKVDKISVGQMWQGKQKKEIPDNYFHEDSAVNLSGKLNNILTSEEEIKKILKIFRKA